MAVETFRWTKYILNTQAYIVNPKRIERILHVLEHPTRDYQIPIDVAYAEAAQRGDLKVFMSTLEHCIQVQNDHKLAPRNKATKWHGLYYHKDLSGRRIDEVFFPECPSKL